MTKDQSAPGRLDQVRLFVNTIDFESGNDKLVEPQSAGPWLVEHGYNASVDAAGLTELREFREAIRAVLLANNGDGDAGEAWQQLVRASNGTCVRIELGADGEGRLAAPDASGGAAAVKAELAGIIYDAILTGTWRRLKACRKDTCLWGFFDHSKNGSGAWCSMAVCGNRVKAQRRRSRAGG